MSQVWYRVLSNAQSPYQSILTGQLLESIQHLGYTLLLDLIGLSQVHPCSKRQIKWITEQAWLLEGQNYCWPCRDPTRSRASLCAHDLNYLICGINHPCEWREDCRRQEVGWSGECPRGASSQWAMYERRLRCFLQWNQKGAQECQRSRVSWCWEICSGY